MTAEGQPPTSTEAAATDADPATDTEPAAGTEIAAGTDTDTRTGADDGDLAALTDRPSAPAARQRRVVPGPDGRTADLGLARVHLRLGSFALARAELETLAGRDALDEEGLVDLAEARWRTGDLIGAGEAADAAVHDGRGPVVAMVIAAESAAARGRPSEARTLAQHAIEDAGGSIDRTFAGMPRSSVWPADPAAPPPTATTMFHAGSEPLSAGRTVPVAAAPPTPADAGSLAAATAARTADGAPGFWDLGDGGRPEDATDALDADAQLESARIALEDGDANEAAHRFALVLRLSPALAPAVLDEIADRPERSLALVRGDAYRLVGRETDARRAFADAAGTTPSMPDPPAGDPT